MNDKYEMSKDDNILNNVNAPNLSPVQVSKVCCLNDGWNYLLDNLYRNLDLVFIEERRGPKL